MLKRLVLFLSILFLVSPIAQANANKIAVIDVQKVVNKSAQVQALKKEQEAKRKELASFIKKAAEEINKETDSAKKKALMDKYDKQLKTKQETDLKAYKTKLEAIDKNINTTIIQHAKTMGYDMVLTKGVVLYGGDDITEAILKVVK